MRIALVEEFSGRAAVLLRAKQPFVVMRQRRVAGIYFPQPDASMPIEMKREIFGAMSTALAKHLRKDGIGQQAIHRDFQKWRRARRAARSRR